MKRNGLFTTICLMAAALLTACTQDGPAEPDTTLTEGRYPLQIDGITIDTQTRMTENSDGTGSVFQPDDWITVETDLPAMCAYFVQEDALIADPYTDPIYWPNKYMPLNITAHFSNTTLISDQSNRLAYLLQSTGSFTYGNPVVLTFTHQLAKVRVELTGSSADEVTQVEVYGYTRFTHRSGSIVTGSEPGWIKMHRTTYDGLTDVWEANLVPGQMLEDNGGTTVSISGPGTLTAGAMHTIKVGVNEFPFPEGTTQINGSTGDISGEGDYYVTGTLTTPITITGGSPDIYLYKAEVSSDSGPAISITGDASPTIHVEGENTVECNAVVSSEAGAGIYVAKGSSVTITGNSSDDLLTARAGADGAGIGGYGDDNPCGDITIKNVMVYAYSESTQAFPGIGSYESCGAITINDATVYAYGTANSTLCCPAIGSYSSVPDITISGSQIHAHRGAVPHQGTSYADWIGRGGSPMEEYRGGAIRGTLTNTIVFKYKWDVTIDQSEPEGLESY